MGGAEGGGRVMVPVPTDPVWYQDLPSWLGILGFILSFLLAVFEVKKRIEDRKPEITYYIRQKENEIGVAEIVIFNSGGSTAFDITLTSTNKDTAEANKLDIHYFAKKGVVKINSLPPQQGIVFPFAVGMKILHLKEPICLSVKYGENRKTNIRERVTFSIDRNQLLPIFEFGVYGSERKLYSSIESISRSIKSMTKDNLHNVYIVSREGKDEMTEEQEKNIKIATEILDSSPDTIVEK
jgi:hypothetical protein